MAANDPPACSAQVSPGAWNSFARWAPTVGSDAAGNKYYWLTFSSKRDGSMNSKLYLTAVVVPRSGPLQTFGAVYMWNQPEESNHTPSWDQLKNFPIP